MFWCPGCKNGHVFYTNAPDYPQWTFNGNLEKPTFTPSLLAYHTENGQQITLCHLFLTNGQIQFLGDCPHELKNQTVPLKPFPE
jgi:hypothetical protein